MKYCSIFLLIVLLSNFDNKANSQILIKYLNAESIINLTYNYREIGDEFTTLSKKNNSLLLKTEKPVSLISNDITHKTLIYAEPGDTINLEINKKGLISYYSKNNKYRKNESDLINNLYDNYGPIISLKYKLIWSKSNNLSSLQKTQSLSSNFNNEIDSLNLEYENGLISKGFKNYFNYIFYGIQKLNEIESLHDKADYKSIKAEIDLLNNDVIEVPEVRNLICNVAFNEFKKTKYTLNQKLKYLSSFYDSAIFNNYLLYRQMLLTILFDRQNVNVENLKMFNNLCFDDKFKEAINIEFDTIKISDSSSYKSFIKQFNGKAVYLDFWASWCIPCMEEMPYYQELIKKYPDIKFVFISIDNSIYSWQKASSKFIFMNPKNSFILSNIKNNMIAKELNISTIPRYFLIDSKGNIINHNAPRPSEEKLINEFEKFQ